MRNAYYHRHQDADPARCEAWRVPDQAPQRMAISEAGYERIGCDALQRHLADINERRPRGTPRVETFSWLLPEWPG